MSEAEYMIPTVCPKCGAQLQYPMHNAGDMVKCTKCFGIVKVPELKAPPPAMPNSAGGMPETTGGEVESFGAYSKGAEANWVDPTELVRKAGKETEPRDLHEVSLDVPEHVRRRHERHIKRRKQQMIVYGIIAVIAICALAGLMVYLQGK